MKTEVLKTGNDITNINYRLLDDSLFRNVVCKIDGLSESQLSRMNKLIDLFFTEPLKGDE